MGLHPRLAHLVPFLHALLAAPTDLYVGGQAPGGQRLFDVVVAAVGRDGNSEQGIWQGFNLASAAFCVGIQPELRALDAELAPFGGMARGQMDDVVAAGPAQEGEGQRGQQGKQGCDTTAEDGLHGMCVCGRTRSWQPPNNLWGAMQHPCATLKVLACRGWMCNGRCRQFRWAERVERPCSLAQTRPQPHV
jgi:hypothetical protein